MAQYTAEEQLSFNTGKEDARMGQAFNPSSLPNLYQAYLKGYYEYYSKMATELMLLSRYHNSPELEAASRFMYETAGKLS